jgi:hypothetical protein
MGSIINPSCYRNEQKNQIACNQTACIIFHTSIFHEKQIQIATRKENPFMKPDNNPDSIEDSSRIRQAISRQAVNQKLGCVAAFEIAAELNVSPKAIGRTMDQMDCRITHCQLGLFGYSPEKKIVIPEKNVRPELKTSIETAARDGRISCLKAWDIAAKLRISKIAVSNACEGLGLRIKPCQLGAF